MLSPPAPVVGARGEERVDGKGGEGRPKDDFYRRKGSDLDTRTLINGTKLR